MSSWSTPTRAHDTSRGWGGAHGPVVVDCSEAIKTCEEGRRRQQEGGERRGTHCDWDGVDGGIARGCDRGGGGSKSVTENKVCSCLPRWTTSSPDHLYGADEPATAVHHSSSAPVSLPVDTAYVRSLLTNNHSYCWVIAGCAHPTRSHLNPTSKSQDQTTASPATTQASAPTQSSRPVLRRPRVIDTFIFFDELSMLRLRYEMLRDVVDVFVLIEATHTHS
eukprot:gene29623-38201_t